MTNYQPSKVSAIPKIAKKIKGKEILTLDQFNEAVKKNKAREVSKLTRQIGLRALFAMTPLILAGVAFFLIK